MNEKQKQRFNEIRVELNRINKEMRMKSVRDNREIQLMKLEEAVSLWKERDKIKPLTWSDHQGLKFLEKQIEALKASQADGWSRRTYKKVAKASKAHENLSKGMGFNPADVK